MLHEIYSDENHRPVNTSFTMALNITARAVRNNAIVIHKSSVLNLTTAPLQQNQAEICSYAPNKTVQQQN